MSSAHTLEFLLDLVHCETVTLMLLTKSIVSLVFLLKCLATLIVFALHLLILLFQLIQMDKILSQLKFEAITALLTCNEILFHLGHFYHGLLIQSLSFMHLGFT